LPAKSSEAAIAAATLKRTKYWCITISSLGLSLTSSRLAADYLFLMATVLEADDKTAERALCFGAGCPGIDPF
jgi:hypothetical protein